MKALLVGRWQPFHKGHKFLVYQARRKYDGFCIGIGSSQESRTAKNPLSVEERKRIIEAVYPDTFIFSVADKPSCERWVEAVEAEIKAEIDFLNLTNELAAITQNDITSKCFRETGYIVERQHMLEPNIFSGTRIRNMIRDGKDEWRNLVPEPVVNVMVEENFIEIIKNTG